MGGLRGGRHTGRHPAGPVAAGVHRLHDGGAGGGRDVSVVHDRAVLVGLDALHGFRVTGKRLRVSTGAAQHLNSGYFWNGKLYCAHSNYPHVPMERNASETRHPPRVEYLDRADVPALGSATWVIVPFGSEGQGIALDRGARLLYSIQRTTREVIVSDLSRRH